MFETAVKSIQKIGYEKFNPISVGLFLYHFRGGGRIDLMPKKTRKCLAKNPKEFMYHVEGFYFTMKFQNIRLAELIYYINNNKQINS